MTRVKAAQKIALVLDVFREGQRRLGESVAATGVVVREVNTLESLGEQLSQGTIPIAVIAYEALWPDPHEAARRLRQRAPRSRLIVAFSDGTTRKRFGSRLWSIGLFDYFVPRSAPPHQLRPILRQAYADALLETADEPQDGSTPSAESASMRFLNRISAAFTNQSRVDALLRELRTKLPQFVDYHLLQVLVVDPVTGDGRLHLFQTRRLVHHVIWSLAERVCAATAPFSDAYPSPDRLVFVDSPPILVRQRPDPPPPLTLPEGEQDSRVIALPMVQCGELIGCVALVPVHPERVTDEHQKTLRLIAYQLATSLRNAQSLQVAEEASLVDELTNAHNRRYLKRALDAEWRRARRYGLQLALAMVDIDHFKRLNDDYGHLIGDSVLCQLASQLRQHLRDTDHLVRYGGEEFLIIFPETGPSEATIVLDRIRVFLQRSPVYSDDQLGRLFVTFSAGVAAIPACAARSTIDLLEMADRALLIAKRTGRDRICMAHGEGFDGVVGEIRGVTKSAEKRRFPRISSRLEVHFVELAGFRPRAVPMQTSNLGAEGVALRGPADSLRKNAHGLLYLGDDPKPQIVRVVWASEDRNSGVCQAGLRFVHRSEFEVAADQPEMSRPYHRALVVADRPQTRAMAQRALQAANFEPRALAPGESPPDDLEQFSAIIIGESAFGDALHRALRQRPELGGRLVLIDEHGDSMLALETVRAAQIHHLVSNDNGAEATLFTTLNKLVIGDYFGLDKYLLAGAAPTSWAVHGSRDKSDVLDGIRDMSQHLRCHPRIGDLVVAAVDEMVINALYHAGTQPRGETFVTVEAGSDGRLLGVAVIDDSGRFRPDDMYRSVGAAFRHHERGLPHNPSQASLGFRIMLTTLSQLAINVDPGRRTEMIGIVDLHKSLREYRQAVPSLGIFYPPR